MLPQAVRQWIADAPANAQRLREGAQAAVEMSPLPRQARAAASTSSRTAAASPASPSGAQQRCSHSDLTLNSTLSMSQRQPARTS